MKKIFFVFYILILQTSIAQLPIGGWRDHFSFIDIIAIIEMNDATIVGASESGIFYLNTDGSIDKLTKASGLSDIGVTSMQYFKNSNTIIIGYNNGNIDIIVDGEINNISDIKRKNIAGNKCIYSISNLDDYAILSCGFGIVKIDIINMEIADTYYIGEDASFVEVYKTLSHNDSMYAATNQGLFVANKNDFLSDYNNWYLSNTPPYTKFIDISVFNNNLYSIINYDGSVIFAKQNDDYVWNEIATDLYVDAKIFTDDNLYIPTGKKIMIYNNNDVLIEEIEHYVEDWTIDPQFVKIANDGRVLIGDKRDGIVIHTNSTDDFYYPSGVYLNQVKKVEAKAGYIYASRGGFKENGVNLWLGGKINYLIDSEWHTVSNSDTRDFYDILIDESNYSHYYIGTWGYGLLEFREDELLNHYDASNSPLETIEGTPIRLSGMEYDDKKNIWMVHASNNHALNVLKTDNTWSNLLLNHTISDISTDKLSILESGIVWIGLPEDGFLALDYNQTIDNEDDDIYKRFYPIDEKGELIGSKIYDFEEDLNGDIWFGTNEGVGVYFDPTNFNEDNFIANRIKITARLNDSLVTNYLLKEQIVYSVAIDGGNRKWFGTGSSGVYLMNETGTKELLHFTTENSPLPSNKVISIAIEPKTGEVFFATSSGLVSYRGDAIDANEQYENVYVFPNPIRPDYLGSITITGLIYDSNVKITDITGNIVFETTSNGGQASWDGNDFSGNRVHTGVYLVFCTNDDGTETFVTKLLFIN